MAFNTSNLLFEHLMPESGLELPLTSGCSGNIHSFLTTSKQNLRGSVIVIRCGIRTDNNKWTRKWSVGCNGCTVQGCFSGEGLNDHEVFGIVYLPTEVISTTQKAAKMHKTYSRSFVFAAGDAVCPILAHLQIGHYITVRPLVVINLLACLDVKEGDFP